MHQPALHQGGRRGLQLRVVHGAHRAPGLHGVRERLRHHQNHLQALASRGPQRVHVQHERGLRFGRDQDGEDRYLHRGHEGRLPDGSVPESYPGSQKAAAGAYRLHRRHRPPYLHQRHHLHPPRLPAPGDREHRQLSHHREEAPHPGEVQPHHLGLRLRPKAPGRSRVRLRVLRRSPLQGGPAVQGRGAHVPPAYQAGGGQRRHLRSEAQQHLPRGREGWRAPQRGDVHERQVPVPLDHRDGRPHGGGVRREASAVLLRRHGRLQPEGPL